MAEAHNPNELDLLSELRAKVRDRLHDRSRDFNVLVAGMPGSGKSTFINSMSIALTGSWKEVGQGHYGETRGKPLDLSKLKCLDDFVMFDENCKDVDEPHPMPEYKKKVFFWDCAGLLDADEETYSTIVSLALDGRIPPSTNMAECMDQTPDRLRSIFTRVHPNMTFDRTVLLLSANHEIPNNLLEAVKSGAREGHDVPIMVMVTNMDKCPDPHDAQKRIKDALAAFSLTGNRVRFEVTSLYCHELTPFPDAEIDKNLLKFFISLLNPNFQAKLAENPLSECDPNRMDKMAENPEWLQKFKCTWKGERLTGLPETLPPTVKDYLTLIEPGDWESTLDLFVQQVDNCIFLDTGVSFSSNWSDTSDEEDESFEDGGPYSSKMVFCAGPVKTNTVPSVHFLMFLRMALEQRLKEGLPPVGGQENFCKFVLRMEGAKGEVAVKQEDKKVGGNIPNRDRVPAIQNAETRAPRMGEQEEESLLVKVKRRLTKVVHEPKENLNVLIVGMPGAGKSSFINSMSMAVTGRWWEVAHYSQSDTRVTRCLESCVMFDDNCQEVDEDHPIPGYKKNVVFWDCAGFPDANEEVYSTIVSLALDGRIPAGTNVVECMGQTSDQLRSRFSRVDRNMTFDRIVFVYSASGDVPNNLVRAIKSGAQQDVPIIVVVTKIDKCPEPHDVQESVKGAQAAFKFTRNRVQFKATSLYCHELTKCDDPHNYRMKPNVQIDKKLLNIWMSLADPNIRVLRKHGLSPQLP